MHTYCLGCKNTQITLVKKKMIMMNKVIINKSRCANCISDKSRFLKQRFNEKSSWNNINLNFSYTSQIQIQQ